ncbi:S-adenosyl-L-methionine-dependent methyltransferase [Gongronella butleri]|nr:S-adenosyl-L-methionine-dependent methyltransferase [Gongronella butleri]
MGYRKGGRWKKKGQSARPNVHREDYETAPEDNERFKAYYKDQLQLTDEDFDKFYETLKTALPSTFRITGTRSNAMQIRKFIEEKYVANLQDVVIDDVKYDAPTPVAWYPDRLCWKIACPRNVLRKSDGYTALQQFLVAENETGNISRQEEVSMIPPMMMDIKPHQKVLDMCAAPGSKTGQIIEAIHANDKLNELPKGLVVANDADYKRSHLLVHQLKRLQSPCFMATNHDGSQFPNINITENGVRAPWQFDRVLCDVPCSGDGTLRKNKKIWAHWSHGAALALHPLQVQIFLRGAQLVKMGGRIVYSTCSFNPIENEAVVAEVLRLTKGALELKDVSHELPELIRRPGLNTWKVMTKDNEYINTLDDIQSRRARFKFPKSAFPPKDDEELHLERCLRIYPQDQDTGGFFVAVFEKVKPLTAADRQAEAAARGELLSSADLAAAEAQDASLMETAQQETGANADDDDDNADETNNDTELTTSEQDGAAVPQKRVAEQPAATKKAKKDVQGVQEAPFELLAADATDVTTIKSFFGLSDAFPDNQFLLRSEENSRNRNVYFVSEAAKAVLQSDDFNRINVVNSGVRLFARQGMDIANCAFRLSSEGVPLLAPYLDDKRKLDIDLDVLKTLLIHAFPMITEFNDETKTKLEKMEIGGILCNVVVNHPNMPANTRLQIPVWRGKSSLNVLLNKHDKKSLCVRLFDIVPEATPAHIKDRALSNQNKNDKPEDAAQEESSADAEAATASDA